MSADYEVHIYDALGTRLEIADDFIILDYNRPVNNIGRFKVSLSSNRYGYLFNDPYRWVDARVEIWRRPKGGRYYLDTDTCYFARKLSKPLRSSGKEFALTLSGPSANQILDRAVIAALGESAGAKKTDSIDNIMRAVVRENLGSLATGIRNRSSFLSVENDRSLGTTTTRSFPYNRVLRALQDLAQESGTTDIPLFFDVVLLNSGLLNFQVRSYQWGSDRTAGVNRDTATVSPDDETIVGSEIVYDFEKEVNYLYVGGAGQNANQVIETVPDSTRINMTPINLHEDYVSGGNTTDTAALQAKGKTSLRDGRPKKILTGTLQDSDNFRYGVDWYFGDKLPVVADNDEFVCRVDAISVSVSGGKETIRANLRGEI